MALTEGQLTSLAGFAEARADRLRSQPVGFGDMRRHLDSGEAVLLGDFPGAPVRFLDRWWRAADDCWEPLSEETGAVLDDDATRWALSVRAVQAVEPAGLQ
ncbi:hypothetical protein [Kitasatospora cinereorecta]|uniref:Uncharacterized protein n=1 Tax=Kitasatospora cinereorecta TaxID=285560 RepID=A0ABW0VN77_9ACTN